MKKNKFLAFVLSAGFVFTLASCSNENVNEDVGGETMTDQQIVNAVMESSALINDNVGSPIRSVEDYGEDYLNELHSNNGGYVVVANKYNYLSEAGYSYDISVSWEMVSSEIEDFISTQPQDDKTMYLADWDKTETNEKVNVTLKGTATYNNATASKTFKLLFNDDQIVIPIEDMENNTSTTVQGYVTAFIEGGLYNDKEEWYQVLIQSGDYAFAIAMPFKDAAGIEGLKVGDAVQVSGTTNFYNGQRQIKNSGFTVEKLTASQAASLAKPNTITIDSVDDFDSTKLLSLSSISGAKVVNVEKIPYEDDEYGQVQAELLLKGKTFYVYADHYNKDIEGKKALYEKLVEIKDSNGGKTLDMDGVMNNYRDAWVGSNGLGEDEVKTGTPALYFIDDEDVIVSNEAYVEVDAVNIVYGGEDLFVGSTVKLDVSLSGSIADGGVNWTSSDDKIATVDENGLVTGVSAGKVTITATSKVKPEVSASIEIESKLRVGQPEYKKMSVSQVLEDSAEDETQAYVVRGKVKCFGSTNTEDPTDNEDAGQFGNLYLEDENDPSKVIQVYGLNGTFRSFSYDPSTGLYDYNNKRDFLTDPNTQKIKLSDTISVVAIRSEFKGNKQISAVLASVNDERNVATKATLQEVIDSAPLGEDSGDTSGQYVFEVTAEIKGWGSSGSNANPDEFGGMVVTDGTNDVVVYGMTAQSNKISYNFKNSNKYSIGNPKDFTTNEVTKEFKIGDKITFECVRNDYKGTLQIVADTARKAAAE